MIRMLEMFRHTFLKIFSTEHIMFLPKQTASETDINKSKLNI